MRSVGPAVALPARGGSTTATPTFSSRSENALGHRQPSPDALYGEYILLFTGLRTIGLTRPRVGRLQGGYRMPQVFPKQMNVVARASILGGLLTLAAALWAGLVYTRSSFGTGTSVAVAQPVPFSHRHHASILGIDCRYCHTSVEYASFAGMQPTKTCMNCHSQIWVGSQMLEPVRESYRTDKSLRWQRVYNLPGFVYFDHSIHVQK